MKVPNIIQLSEMHFIFVGLEYIILAIVLYGWFQTGSTQMNLRSIYYWTAPHYYWTAPQGFVNTYRR